MPATGFLFCCDPLRPRHPDPAFAQEAAAARRAGARTASVDHDALLAGDAEAAVGRVPQDSGAYWYRGWMVPPARYAELQDALAARGCSLLTDAPAYRTAHELPGWYEVFADLTPRSVWRALAAGEALPEPSVWSGLAGGSAPARESSRTS